MFVAGLRQPATGSDIRGLLGDHAGKLLFCRVWPSREALRNGSDQLVAHLQMADGADVEVVKGVLQSEPVLTAAITKGVLPERGGLLVETSLHRIGSTAFRVRVFLRHVLLLLELLQLLSLFFFVPCWLFVGCCHFLNAARRIAVYVLETRCKGSSNGLRGTVVALRVQRSVHRHWQSRDTCL